MLKERELNFIILIQFLLFDRGEDEDEIPSGETHERELNSLKCGPNSSEDFSAIFSHHLRIEVGFLRSTSLQKKWCRRHPC